MLSRSLYFLVINVTLQSQLGSIFVSDMVKGSLAPPRVEESDLYSVEPT